MGNGSGNGPLMAITFIVGLGAISVTGVFSSILVAVLVGALGKAVDVGLRALIARRESHWRQEAERLEAELRRIRSQEPFERAGPGQADEKQTHAGQR